jgi:hypothetical protein
MNDYEYLDEIQPTDNNDTDTAVRNTLAKKARDLESRREREDKARVRGLLRSAQAAIIGESESDVDAVLSEIQALLSGDDELARVLAPGFDGLADRKKVAWRRYSRRRERWRADDVDAGEWPRRDEYQTYVAVAKALQTIHAGTDQTRYAPVTMEKLDVRGARSPVDGDPTPIGRVRVRADSSVRLEKRATEIPHVDCEHVLVIANPREGKDALIARIAGNLKTEHGYKWVALHDDGRNETPMICAPNDETAIQQSLQSFGQSPEGYKTKVFVPAVGLPDTLPRNHVPFTIGVDALTPEIITQLSGVNPQGSTQERIKIAVRESGGSVNELIRLLEKYAEDTSAEVTVTEVKDGDELESADVDSTTRTYEMGEDSILEDCAKSLMLLASEGLLADSGADTNLDMNAVVRDQEHVAVLNSNFLPDGDEHLKYLIENVWLQLINKVRDENPHLPRVAVEIREIKELAPSSLNRAKYSHIAKSLRQTLFHLSSQGGSRRIMLLGSTQYLRDVYLPVRGNMPLKILLKMGEEKISILESAGFDFSDYQREQLKSFQTGWGMLLEPEGKTFPINWTGPKCALGLGDLEWRDRYGFAMGFRVQGKTPDDATEWTHDADHYFGSDGQRHPAPPSRQEWFLLPDDLESEGVDADRELVDDDALLSVLETRRDYEIKQDLRPEPVDVQTEQRELQLISTEEARERDKNKVYQKFGIDGILRDWTRRRQRTVEKMCMVLRAIRDTECRKYDDMADESGVGISSIKQYANDETRLQSCMEKVDGEYQLTPVGKKALGVSWNAVFQDMD